MEETDSQIRAMQRDAERFGELVRVCPNGIALCTSSVIQTANPALANMVGESLDSLSDRPVSSLFPEDVRPTISQQLAAMLAEPQGHNAVCSTQVERADGRSIPVQVSVDRFEALGNADAVFVFRPLAIFRDTSILNQEELVQRTHMLKMSVFGELAAALIHELGQPLTAAKGAADLVQSQRSDSQPPQITGRAAEILLTSIGEVGVRFQKIWNFVRTRKPEIAPVSINETVQNVFDLTAAAARHAGIELRFVAGDVTTADVDGALVSLVTTGLIRRSVNALTANVSEPRVIRVTTSDCPGEFVAIEIEHNGPGLAAAESGVPGPDFADPSSEHLALSTFRAIIDENGGVLNIQPTLDGTGVRYRILLPGSVR